MKQVALFAFILGAIAPLFALNYTVSIRVDTSTLTEAQGVTEVPFFAELHIDGKMIATTAVHTLKTATHPVPVTLTFNDVQTMLADALVQTPDRNIEMVYFYKATADGEPIELARQCVPAVAYTAIAETVGGAIGSFTVNEKLTAKNITLDEGGRSTLTLSESTAHRVETLTCETLNVDMLQVQDTLQVTDEATLSGEISFKGTLSGMGLPPIGTIVMMEEAFENEGWQLCDGSLIEDVESPLYGKTVPDLRNRYLRATADVKKVGNLGGEASVTLQGKNIPAHNHPYTTSDPKVRTTNYFAIVKYDTGGGDWINHSEDDLSTQKRDYVGASNPSSAGSPIVLEPPYCTFNFYLRIK